MYKLGDIDNDGELTIKDATVVQRAEIGLTDIVKRQTLNRTLFLTITATAE